MPVLSSLSGHSAKSVGLLEKAMRLNPFYPDWYLWYLADAYDALGRYEDVVAAIQRMHDPSEGGAFRP
jgi:adenylate cyclase